MASGVSDHYNAATQPRRNLPLVYTNYCSLVNTRVGHLILATMHYQTVDLLNSLTSQLGTNFVVWTILSYIRKEEESSNMAMAALRGTISYK